MFGYNITSLVIILVIALLLFGPKRLPELGDSIGKAIKGFKKATEGEPEPLPPSGGELKNSAPGNETAAATKTCPQCHKNLGGNSLSVHIAVKKSRVEKRIKEPVFGTAPEKR